MVRGVLEMQGYPVLEADIRGSALDILRNHPLIGVVILDLGLPDLLRQSWPQLAQAGFTGLSWQLDWFGTSLAGVEGVIGRGCLSRSGVRKTKDWVSVCIRPDNWR